MPRRENESDRQRDQEILSQMANDSPEQMTRDLVVIKKRRKEEMAAMKKSEKENAAARADAAGSADVVRPRTVHASSRTAERHQLARARCKRNGRDYHLPTRSSEADRARDQAFLDAIEVGLSAEEVDVRFEKIRTQRNREIATGELEDSPEPGSARKRRKRVEPKPREEGALQKFFLRRQHASMVAKDVE